jgi:DNA-binding CsgD family transcriptional regulator
MSTAAPARELLGRRDECAELDRLLAGVRAGRSRVLVLRGEAGIGKSALLAHAVAGAAGFRVVRAKGIESEMELPFAGLHQLCGPLLDGLEQLPAPQRKALQTAFGLTAGDAPDRFLVGLATLGLLAAAAEEAPLLCVVDDGQWLDLVSAQTLGFVAHRLLAEQIGMVVAVRGENGAHAFAELPELVIAGLGHHDAGTLLDSVLTGPVDERVHARIVAETRGNPLALLELPRGLTPDELAGGFGLPGAMPLAGRIEDGFQRRLRQLPGEARRLLLVAAAEPVGDATLLARAADRLGIGTEPVAAARASGLLEIGARVRFRHPLVRSAAYRAASPEEKLQVHEALAEVTDPAADPDRRAWHRAQATSQPDEQIALELTRRAGRAQARGGLAAAAAFLERAASLTPDPADRARRALAAARAKREAGALDVALGLLVIAEQGPPDALRSVEVDRLRGQIALDQRRGADAARLLRGASQRLEPIDAPLAREAHLEALTAAIWEGDIDGPPGLRHAAEIARAAPPAPDPPRAVDLVLDGLALRYAEGHAAAVPIVRRALRAVVASDECEGGWLWLAGSRVTGGLALEVWDWETRHALAVRQVEQARRAGALVQLQFALSFLAGNLVAMGELSEARRLLDEDRLIGEATGNPPVALGALAFEAYRGREAEASALLEATIRESAARGQAGALSLARYSSAVLHNGLGRHAAARDAARQALDCDLVGYGTFIAPELAEAAARTGDTALLVAAHEWVAEHTAVTTNDWALAIAARVRALLAGDDDAADHEYRESLARLRDTPLRVVLARGRLLYGEWLSGRGRRADAREQLRTAHEMLDTMGLEAFADRARRALAATGESARKRSVAPSDDLTPQETEIARLAADGLSNQGIGSRLFLSPRTIEWHLNKVFTKLGISSRRQLAGALPGATRAG